MGYFEGLTNASFKKNSDGTSIFYPWGIFGRGLVIPDDQGEERLRSFLTRYCKVSLPSLITVGILGGWVWAALLLPICGAWFYLGIKTLVSEYAYSKDKITIKESCAGSAAEAAAEAGSQSVCSKDRGSCPCWEGRQVTGPTVSCSQVVHE